MPVYISREKIQQITPYLWQRHACAAFAIEKPSAQPHRHQNPQKTAGTLGPLGAPTEPSRVWGGMASGSEEVEQLVRAVANGDVHCSPALEAACAQAGALARLAQMVTTTEETEARALAAATLNKCVASHAAVKAYAPEERDAALSSAFTALLRAKAEREGGSIVHKSERLHVANFIGRISRVDFPSRWADPLHDCLNATQQSINAVAAANAVVKALASRRMPVDRRAVTQLVETHAPRVVQLGHSALLMGSHKATQFRSACKLIRRVVELCGADTACAAAAEALGLVRRVIDSGTGDVEVAAGARKLLQCIPAVAKTAGPKYHAEVAPLSIDVCWHALAQACPSVHDEIAGVALAALACTPRRAVQSATAVTSAFAPSRLPKISPGSGTVGGVAKWLLITLIPLSDELIGEWCTAPASEAFFGSDVGDEEPMSRRARSSALSLLHSLVHDENSTSERSEAIGAIVYACSHASAEVHPFIAEAAFAAAATTAQASSTMDAIKILQSACAEISRAAMQCTKDDSKESIHKLLSTRAALLAIAATAKSVDGANEGSTLSLCLQRCHEVCTSPASTLKPEIARCAMLAIETIHTCRNDLVPTPESIASALRAGCSCGGEVDALTTLLDATASLVCTVGDACGIVGDDSVINALRMLWATTDTTARVQILSACERLLRACGRCIVVERIIDVICQIVAEALGATAGIGNDDSHASNEAADVLLESAVPLCEQFFMRMPLNTQQHHKYVAQCIQKLCMFIGGSELNTPIACYTAAANAIAHAAVLNDVDAATTAARLAEPCSVKSELLSDEPELARALTLALDTLVATAPDDSDSLHKMEHALGQTLATFIHRANVVDGKAGVTLLCSMARLLISCNDPSTLQRIGVSSVDEACEFASFAASRFDDARSRSAKVQVALVLVMTLALGAYNRLLELLPEAVALCTSCAVQEDIHQRYAWAQEDDGCVVSNCDDDLTVLPTVGDERLNSLQLSPSSLPSPILALQKVQQVHGDAFNSAWQQLDDVLQQKANDALAEAMQRRGL